jgi:hypothetical protein
MLETRIFGRDKQLSYVDYYDTEGSFDSITLTSELTDQSRTMNGDQVGMEFATPSVTSPGLEEYVGLSDTATALQFEGAIGLLIDSLQYFYAYDRGFMTVIFT